MTDDPDDEFLLLLPMKMMIVTMMTISTRKTDDNNTEIYNNYDIKIYVFAFINRKFQKNPKCFNLAGNNTFSISYDLSTVNNFICDFKFIYSPLEPLCR